MNTVEIKFPKNSKITPDKIKVDGDKLLLEANISDSCSIDITDQLNNEIGTDNLIEYRTNYSLLLTKDLYSDSDESKKYFSDHAWIILPASILLVILIKKYGIDIIIRNSDVRELYLLCDELCLTLFCKRFKGLYYI